MEELPLKSCINLLQIQHPVFDKNNSNLNQSETDLQRLDTQDLFSGKKPYFLLEQFVMTLELLKQPQKLSQLRTQNNDLEKKLAQSQEFFNIPEDRNNLLDQHQVQEKVSQSPPMNLPSQPAMYRPSLIQQPQMTQPPMQQPQQQYYPGPNQQQNLHQRHYTNQPLAPSYQQNTYFSQRPPVRRIGFGMGFGLRHGMRGSCGFGKFGRGGRFY